MEENKLVRYTGGGELEKVGNSIAITKKILAIERRNLFDFFDFFPITTLYCDMSEAQRKYYDDLKISIKKSILNQENKGLRKFRDEIFRGITELRMACYGKSFIDDGTYIGTNSIKSAILLKELVRLKDSKVFIVSPFLKVLDWLAVLLSGRGLPYRQLDGRTENRVEVVSTFSDLNSNCNILLASQKAIGLVNISVDYVFILSPSGLIWDLVHIVTRDRVFRLKESYTVYALIGRNTIEEKLIDLQKQLKEPDDWSKVLDDDLIRLFD